MSQSQSALMALYQGGNLEQKAEVAEGLGKYSLAESMLKQALSLKESALGADSPQLATTLDALGKLYTLQKKYDQAEEVLKRALSLLEKGYYADHYYLAPVLTHLGECYERQAKFADAEPVFKKAMEIFGKTLSGDHHETLHSIKRLADLYVKLEKYADAETLFKKAIKTADKPLGPLEDFLYELAKLYQAQGKNDESVTTYQQALEQFEQRNKPYRVADCLESYAGLLSKMDQSEQAQKLKSRAQEMRAKYNPNPSELFTSNMV